MGKSKPPPKPGGKKPPKKNKKKPRPGDSKRLSRGRQPEITAEKVRLLVEAVGNGTPKSHAAAMVNISYDTYRNWVLRGEEAWEKAGQCDARVNKADRLYVNLFVQTGAARAATIDEALANIRKAGKKNWQADAWLVGRLCPGTFGDNRREIGELKKALGDLLKEMAEFQNTKMPDVPKPQPEHVPEAAGLIPVVTPEPVPAPAVPELVPVTVLETNAGGTS